MYTYFEVNQVIQLKQFSFNFLQRFKQTRRTSNLEIHARPSNNSNGAAMEKLRQSVEISLGGDSI